LIQLVEVDRIEVIAGLAFDEFAGDNTVPIREGRIRGAKLLASVLEAAKAPITESFRPSAASFLGLCSLGMRQQLSTWGRPESPGQGGSQPGFDTR
jgi:hypothetical protein